MDYVEETARTMAVVLEDSNCSNPEGHWEGVGGMRPYTEERKEAFRKAARCAIAVFNKEHDQEAMVLVALAIHSSGLCTEKELHGNEAEASCQDWDCLQAAAGALSVLYRVDD